MKRMILSLTATGILMLCLAASCPAALTESGALAAVADRGILPSLTRAASTAKAMDQAARNLCRQPDAAHLDEARKAWRVAYLAWCRALPFIMGSAAVIDRQIGKWPVNAVVLDAAVARQSLAGMLKNPDARGWAGAEHLLFVPKDAQAATADGRCAHLQDVTAELAKKIAKVKNDWVTDKESRFKNAGDGNPFLLPDDALSLLMARTLNVTEVLLRDRIGGPSSFFEGQSRPDNLEAWKSGATVNAIRATVSGIALAVTGDGRTGLTRLVATKNGLYESSDPWLAKKIDAQLKRVDKVLEKLEGTDLHLRVKQKPSTLEDLYEELEDLQKQLVEAALVLELDVRSGLEVQLTE